MRIAVLLSGGVDSSVVLARLKRQGHDVTAFYLKIWLQQEYAFLGDCPWQDDLAAARAVCRQWDVPLEVVSLQQAYYERVVTEVLAELRAGRTPSPDLLCNRRVKLGAFDEGIGGEFDRIATGHYARQVVQGGRTALWRAVDPVKDQTYFLARLRPEQLERVLFVLGDHTKAEVRAWARQWNLPTWDRRDSQGICFLGTIRYDAFVRAHLGERPGAIRQCGSGRVLGRHRGHWFYTIGQRQGLGLAGGPWYVVRKDVDSSDLWVCHGRDLPTYARRRFTVARCHWLGRPPAAGPVELKLRHGPAVTTAEWQPTGDGGVVTLPEPDAGIAPGQYAVFYRQQECLGAAVIDS